MKVLTPLTQATGFANDVNPKGEKKAMPHFILEYSSNLDNDLNVAALFKNLHETAIDIGEFPASGIRSRAIRCEEYRVAEGDPENSFVHLTVKIGSGRDIEVRRAAADRVFKTMTEFLQPIFDKRYLSIGFELIELHPELIYKKNNIQNKLCNPNSERCKN